MFSSSQETGQSESHSTDSAALSHELVDSPSHDSAYRLGNQTRIFQAVADCTYDWESWLDVDGKLVWVNSAVERLTGYSVDECMKMRDYPLSIVLPEDAKLISEILAEAIAGTSGNDREFRILRKDGTECWFGVSWQPLLDEGRRIGIRMSMRDIRERKAMEAEREKYSLKLEELAEARAASIVALKKKKLRIEKLAALGGMAAKVAHEINNPIAGIKNAIRLVRDDPGLEESSSKMLKLVDREIDRVSKLLQQMYQLYKPAVAEAGEFDVIDVLEDVITMVNTQCLPHQVNAVRVDWPESLVVSLCEQELRQILHNLLLNAWEASPANADVEIEAHKLEGNRLRILVRDHGCGIAPDLMSKIFEPFVTTKQDSRKSGSGLGLAIAQSLANALGGAIEIEATPGGGATLIVELPFDKPN